ncbi:hypothetical protein CgunFtcFv8_003881 [Champsocephalus gunnari]|uniref:Uncharacterized protein n=1 Tax=Champsocephalus gunnari TaxID=52237 RepID=A0AAN8HY74_CHAGU|nr:hypothetical protein CgunFtcFv8_003881 [Champsocephalus gunnari]
MKYRAGLRSVAFVWMGVLMQGLDAGRAPKMHSAVSCRPKELTALTKTLVVASLKLFDKDNGEPPGTWAPGFPELQVEKDSPPQGSKVQCSLLFMAQGLKKVLEDQRDDLNPNSVELHKKLGSTISNVNLLAACAKHTIGGECSLKPPPPQMPKDAFKKKQWSHTLLMTARAYLDWLELKFGQQSSKVKGKNKIQHKALQKKPTPQKYLEGSGYLL